MKQTEILMKKKWSDRSGQEFLSVHIDEWTEKKIILSLNAEADAIRIKEKILGKGKTVKEIRALTAPEGQFPEESLISAGAIVALGEKKWEEAPIALLLQDLSIPSELNALTTPTKLLDMPMMAGVIKSLLGIIPWTHKEGRTTFFFPMIYDYRIFTNDEDFYELIKRGRKKGWKKSRETDILILSNVETIILPGMVDMELRINGETIDYISNVYAFYDRKRNTLEYRKILRYPELDPSKINGVFDGDGFRRNIILTTPKFMAEYVSAIKKISKEDIIETFLKGSTDDDFPHWGLQICGGTNPYNNWYWYWYCSRGNAKTRVALPLNSTLVAFVTEMLK